jgi:hypothetical protein
MPEPLSPIPVEMPRRERWLLAACIAVITAAYAPMLFRHAVGLWDVPAYRYFPLLVVGGVLIIRSRLREEHLPADTWLWPLVVSSVLTLAAGIALDSTLLGVVSCLLFLAACAHFIGGWPLVRTVLPLWLALWLLVRLPFESDLLVLNAAYGWALEMALAIVDRLGVLHVAVGGEVRVPGHRLFADASEQGVLYLIGSAAIAGLYCAWRKRGPIHTAVVVLWTAAWAFVADVLRIAVVVCLASEYPALADGSWLSIGVSCVLLPIVAWLAWNMDGLLAFRRKRVRRLVALDTDAPPIEPRAAKPHTGAMLGPDGTLVTQVFRVVEPISPNTWSTVAIAGAFALLLVAQGVLAVAGGIDQLVVSPRQPLAKVFAASDTEAPR